MEMKPLPLPIPTAPPAHRDRPHRQRGAGIWIAALALLLGAHPAFGRPANPKPLVRLQPDGTEVRIRAVGDERVVFYEDEDGYTVLRDADGWWRYADPASHKTGKLVATSFRVGPDRMPPGARRHVRPLVDPTTFLIEWDQKDDGTIGELFRKWREGSGRTGRPVGALGQTAPVGVPLLVIPVEFSDWHHTNNAGDPAGEPGYNPNVTMPGNTAAAWQDLFGNPAVPGGLNHYYDEVSYGQFQWNVAVAACDPANAHANATCNGGWYRNPSTMAYWGADRSQGSSCYTDSTRNIRDLIEWAIKAAEPEVGYAAYDADGNGQISDAELMILVVHARDGQENYGDGCGASPADPQNDHIWSHKWNIDTAVTVDGKTVPAGKTYSINPEFEPGLAWNAGASYYDVVDKWFGVGVYAHESFHTLGAPDLYDYGYDANVAGEWDLMDAGSYNGAKAGTHPAHMGSPLKQDIRLNADPPASSYGWIADAQMVDVPAGGAAVQTIDALAGPSPVNVMHQLVTPADGTEWIVLENRAATGYYEPYLPEHGILAWHKDTNGSRDAWPYAANVLRKGWANTATGLNTPTAGAALSLEDGETVLTSTSDPSHDLNSGASSGLLDIRCAGAEGTRMQYVYGSISGANPGLGGAAFSGGADSDPYLDNDETATLSVTVDNSSCAGTAAASVVLGISVAADSPVPASAVTIAPATVSLGDLAAGASADAVFSVGLACDPEGYAGKSVKFEFSITGTGFPAVAGSFSKDVDKDYAFFDDAEGGTAGWTSSAPFNPSAGCVSATGHGDWSWQVPTDRRHGGTRAYHTPETTPSSNLAYTNPSEVWVSPTFTVPAGAKQLRFWSAASIPATGYTRARVWVMPDDSGTWTRLNWYRDSGDLTWEEVTHDLAGFDGATQLKLMFAVYTYGCWPAGTASAEGWYVDDIAIVVDEQQTCSVCTTPPGAPAILSIVDADACAQSGVLVNYTPGSGATSHDLLRDGAVVVSGYVSGAVHDPGDGASHDYVVRAVKTSCPSADSPASSYADGDSAPAIPAAGNTGPVCEGGSITLTASTIAGATYAWTGPNGFVSAEQNPTIPGATAANAGTYSVTATVAGCTSPAGTTSVVVNPTPAAPAITAPPSVFPGQGFTASVPEAAGVTWAWTVTNGTVTAGDGTSEISVTAGPIGPVTISVVGTDSATGCSSAEASVSVPVGLPATKFYTVAPCRLFDTRMETGPSAAAPALGPGETRTFEIGSRCGLDAATVRSLSVNQTVTQPAADGEIVLYRGDLTEEPISSSLSFRAGKTRANNALLELSREGDGTFKVRNRAAGPIHFILDVNGSFRQEE